MDLGGNSYYGLGGGEGSLSLGTHTYVWTTSSVIYKMVFSEGRLSSGKLSAKFKIPLKIWKMFKKIVHD